MNFVEYWGATACAVATLENAEYLAIASRAICVYVYSSC
jgi:hypothetical protein